MRSACCGILSVLLIAAAAAAAASDAELTKGIRQVEDGYLEDAVTTLDNVVRRLSGQPAHGAELAQAYLHLGIAYAQLDSDKSARASFREALKLDASLTLGAGQWPPKVLRAFAAIRAEVATPSPSPTAAAPAPRPAEARRAGEAKTFDDGPYMWVPPGSFMMGCVSSDSECGADEKPQHRVTLTRGYSMARTDVTVAQYRRSGRPTPKAPGFTQGEDHPVVNVSWNDADAYCRALGARLPTEAEWEYAARGGRPDLKYVWGNDTTPIVGGVKQANVGDENAKRKYRAGCPTCKWFEGFDDGFTETSPVGSFPANGFGLTDMAGNVWQWTADWYDQGYYASSPAADPSGPSSGTERVLRGGARGSGPQDLRVSNRVEFNPGGWNVSIGCRCVRDASP